MKIALIGYGKMGKTIEQLAKGGGHEIVTIIDPKISGSSIEALRHSEAEVCIDFTQPDAVIPTLAKVAPLGINFVIGTTGWYDRYNEVEKIVGKSNMALFHASNFSIGVHLFLNIVKTASSMILDTGLYDVAGIEEHHEKKLDAPSGTAKNIIKAIADNSNLAEEEIPFTSVRCGHIPGTHTVLFDSKDDTISFTHTARSREGFALGALTAAQWIKDKKGIYTMDDMLQTRGTLCNV